MFYIKERAENTSCKICGKEFYQLPNRISLCGVCIDSLKTQFLEKHNFQLGQTVYTFIKGSKNGGYTARAYNIYKIEFSNWLWRDSPVYKYDVESLKGRFSVKLKNINANSYLTRKVTEIYNTADECLQDNKSAIRKHIVSTSKNKLADAIGDIGNNLSDELNDEFISKLIDKTIQETKFEQQKILSIEKPLPEDEVYKNCVNIVNRCHETIKKLNKAEQKIADLFGFENTGIKLFDGIFDDLEDVCIDTMKNNKSLNDIYYYNIDSFTDWLHSEQYSFEKWLEQHKEDKQ